MNLVQVEREKYALHLLTLIVTNSRLDRTDVPSMNGFVVHFFARYDIVSVGLLEHQKVLVVHYDRSDP